MESCKQSLIDNCGGSLEDKVALENVGGEHPVRELQMGTNTPTESWARSQRKLHCTNNLSTFCLCPEIEGSMDGLIDLAVEILSKF